MSNTYTVQMDGDAWSAVNQDFINLQESLVGWGYSPESAIKDLIEEELAQEHLRWKTVKKNLP